MDEKPWRCVTCGGETQAVVGVAAKGILTQLDPRYAVRWCRWCKRARESIRAATVPEATAGRVERYHRVPDATPIKGGW